MKTRQTCSQLKLGNLRKLRTMGLTYREIGRIYNTSGVQIHYWINGRHSAHLRAKPETCEICEKTKALSHHHWGDLRVGIWLCPGCRMAADILDRIPTFPKVYADLMEGIQKECAAQIQLEATSTERKKRRRSKLGRFIR